MIKDYKFHLAGRNDSSGARKKRICPNCGRKTFVLYVNTETGEPLHETVGKCDRLDHCAWHYTPKQYFADRGSSFEKSNSCPPAGSYGRQSPEKPQPKPSFIDNATFNKSLAGYDNNTLIVGLCQRLGQKKTMRAVELYRIGTTKDGGTIFWQLDADNNVRTGKVIQYKPDLHRNKEVKPNWAHTALKLPDFNLTQCLFGLHLLPGNNMPAVIVESEKSAVIGSIYHPRYVWLATGGKQNFRLIEEAAGQLQGRKVKLVPDLGATADWEAKAQELRNKRKLDISVYKYLERIATEQERADGLDIADFLLRNAPPKATAAPQPATHTATPAIERLQPAAIKSTSGQETAAEAQETEQKWREFRNKYKIDFTKPTPPPDEDGRVKDVLVLLKWGAVPYSYILSELKESTEESGIDVYFRYVKPAIERGVMRKGTDGMCRLAAGMPQPFKEFMELIAPWYFLRNHKGR